MSRLRRRVGHGTSLSCYPGGLAGYARWCGTHRRRLLAIGLVLGAVLGLVSLGLDNQLSNGGVVAGGIESTRAEAVLAKRFGAGPADLVLRVTANDKVDSPEASKAGVRLSRWIAAQENVRSVQSYWISLDPVLRSSDQRSAVIQADLPGSDADAARAAENLVPRIAEQARPLRVTVSGAAWASVEALQMAKRDLHRAELLSTPLLALILLLAFRSAYAALLPVLIGGLTFVATMAALRLTSHVTLVSVYAPNVAIGLSLGLAIDYSLFITTRFRDELRRGAAVEEALQRSMMTAGRTVLFSGLTVATATAGLLVIPVGVVRSLAWTTILVVIMGVVSTMLVQPAMLATVGERINRGDPVGWLRGRSARRRSPADVRTHREPPSRQARTRRARSQRKDDRDDEHALWHRIATLATRRPVSMSAVCVVVLGLLAIPFAHIRFGMADERVLPTSAEAHVTNVGLNRDFSLPIERDFFIVLPRTDAARDASCKKVAAYAERLAAVPEVVAVRTVTGIYRGTTGARAGQKAELPKKAPREQRFGCGDAAHVTGPRAPDPAKVRDVMLARRHTAGGATLVVVSGPHGVQSAGARRMLERIRAVPAPGERLIAGRTPQAINSLAVIRGQLPLAGVLVMGAVLVLLFLFTGGLLVSVKALVVGAISLTASCGAIVAIFQDGHLRSLLGGFTVMNQVELMSLIFTVTVAFGVSIDYEVFLLSRIKEYYRAGGDHTAAVVRGIASTGRLVTVAAVAVAVSMGFLAVSGLQLLKIIGFGLALGVLVDATIVRGLLVPAVMRLTGPANWWAPRPLARLHERAGLSEADLTEPRPHRLARMLALLRAPGPSGGTHVP
ncbi:MMPL family transporter [Actinomadura fulvescens]|uniref:MMPL family transporter n=1 Tax=Actinomadura fulvescens TaxID=46160 RepID=UPI0031E46EB0